MTFEIVQQVPTSISIRKVIEAVSSVTGVSEADIMSNSRVREIVFARNMCFSICRIALGMTFMNIGKHFNKHHATIIYAVKTNDLDLKSNVAYRSRFETILSQLGVRFAEQVTHGDVIQTILSNMFRREPIVID